MADGKSELSIIKRDEIREDHVMFVGADGKEVTEGDMFRRFGCDVPHAAPDTPDRIEPDVVVEREFFEDDILVTPAGSKVRIFGLKDPRGEARFPAETMRFVEGQVVHSRFHSKKNTHTIHHHGIEPSNFNDGVGHTSFEITSSYTYQFRASHSGTYFYHCHKNTVLHFEMGMYGLLIIDPPKPDGAIGPNAPYRDGGAGFVRRADEIVPYDVEALWAADEIDSRWHALINHMAGISCPFYNVDQDGRPTGHDDPGLNDFNPDIFVISGVPARNHDSSVLSRDPIMDVAVHATVGSTILARIANAGYTVQEFRFHGLDVEVVEMDGRTLGQMPFGSYSRPFLVPAETPIRFTSAQRWSVLVRPQAAGSYPVTVTFRHWVSGEVLAVVETRIQVV